MIEKKIGFDARKIKDYGIGTYIQNILLRVPDSLSAYCFNLFCYFNDIDYIQKEINQNFLYIPAAAPHYSLREHIILSRLAKKLELYLLHTPHYVVPAFIKCKSIVTIHDVIHLLYPGKGLAQKLIASFLMRSSIRKATRIITVSENSRKDIIRFFPEAESRITVIYNGVDEYFLSDYNEAVMKDSVSIYDLPSRYILYVGNHLKHKNIEKLVRAFALFSAQKKEYSLLLVGGIRLAGLKNELPDSLLSKIKIVPFIDKKVLKAIYHKADFLVMPSLYEGFGLPLLEAMACRTPVMCSDIAVFHEIAHDIPLYFNPQNEQEMLDSMLNLSENKKLKETMASKGYERAQDFTWKKSAQQHSKIYHEIVQI